MQTRIKILVTVLLFWLASIPCQAQVWPGDVNNNGIVNNIDFLYMAEAIFVSGPPRIGPGQDGIEWEEKTVDAFWANSFPNGVNYAYGDCDGDGFIFDHYAIEENYGLTHGTVVPEVFSPGTQGIDPPLFIDASFGNLFENSFGIFAINLGTPALSVENITGIAFTLKYDPAVFGTNPVDYSPGPWLNDGTGNPVFISHNDPVQGTLEIAIKKNGPPLNGFGEIGLFFIVIEDDVVGMTIESIETSISIEKVLLLDHDFTEQPVYADSTIVTIFNDEIVSSTSVLEKAIQVYSQPASNLLFIDSPKHRVKKVEFTTLTGILVQQQDFNNLRVSTPVSTSDLEAGFYLLKILTDEGWLVKKTIIQH